jgi:DNA-directed RNA polymerase specialized sigma24 family protein
MTDDPAVAAEDRFREVFAHLSEVVAYARRRGSRDPEAIAAEVLTVAWRKLADVPRDDARPWLYATARNLVRAERRKTRLPDPGDMAAAPPTEADPGASLVDPELMGALSVLSATSTSSTSTVVMSNGSRPGRFPTGLPTERPSPTKVSAAVAP